MTPRSTARRVVVAALLAAAAPLASGCTGTNAAVLTVTRGPVGLVRQLAVHINSHDGKHSDDFVVPATEGEPLVFPRTVSLTFPSTVKTWLDVRVEGRAGGVTVAEGEGFSSTSILAGEVTRIDVELEAVSVTPADDMAGSQPDLAQPDLANRD